ncbi:hypothetical protein AAHC03_021047 [Spirometra sp. Aus1]
MWCLTAINMDPATAIILAIVVFATTGIYVTVNQMPKIDTPGEASYFMHRRIRDFLSKMSFSPPKDKVYIGVLPPTIETLFVEVTEDLLAQFEIDLINTTIVRKSTTSTEPFALMETVRTSARARVYRCGSSDDFGVYSLGLNVSTSKPIILSSKPWTTGTGFDIPPDMYEDALQLTWEFLFAYILKAKC